MAMSLPLARTVIWATVAFSTVPSNFGGCGPLFGLRVLTMMGTAVSATGMATDAGTWALEAAAANALKLAASTQRRIADCDISFIPIRRWRCAMISENECPAGS